MKPTNAIRHVYTCSRGVAAIEFALIAPALLTLFIGIMQLGIQLQSYNAVRSLTSDISRYTMVQYQKDHNVASEDIESVTYATAMGAPYNLSAEQLDVEISEGVGPFENTKEILIDLEYTPISLLSSFGVDGITISYSKAVFVPSVPAA